MSTRTRPINKPYSWRTTGFSQRPDFLRLFFLLTILFASLILFSCSPEPDDNEASRPDKENDTEDNGQTNGQENGKDENGEGEGEKGKDAEEPDYLDKYPQVLPEEIRDLPPNPEGEIMILMYHEIGEPEGEWTRTPDNFRRDLQTLYDEGYRLTSLNDVLDGDIDVPPGTTPVVLTFDDGTVGQFRYIEDDEGEWKMDPDCAVAILEGFYRENPDFGLEGSFYIFYENPFRQQEQVDKKLNYLVERGFEIGNHGYNHGNLRDLSGESPEAVEKELALHVKRTRDYLPDYRARSLALPYGAWPDPRELAAEGEYEGTNYRHEAVLLVGAHPAPSPFHEDFDPLALPRVRASEKNTEGVGMYDWLERYRQNPERRYIQE